MSFPRFKAVGDHGVMVVFADEITDAGHAAVLQLDQRLQRRAFPGFCEAVPAFVSLFVEFDPLVTEHGAVEAELRRRLAEPATALGAGRQREVLVCYDAPFASDLDEVAKLAGCAPADVIAAHLSGDYRVFMYGFAPGYAYLAGVPEAIRLPRKTTPRRAVPAGSVLIAGPQCLVSTLTMPTGWWIIGRSPTPILTTDSDRPFLFDVGDEVVFRRIGRDAFEGAEGSF